MASEAEGAGEVGSTAHQTLPEISSLDWFAWRFSAFEIMLGFSQELGSPLVL